MSFYDDEEDEEYENQEEVEESSISDDISNEIQDKALKKLQDQIDKKLSEKNNNINNSSNPTSNSTSQVSNKNIVNSSNATGTTGATVETGGTVAGTGGTVAGTGGTVAGAGGTAAGAGGAAAGAGGTAAGAGGAAAGAGGAAAGAGGAAAGAGGAAAGATGAAAGATGAAAGATGAAAGATGAAAGATGAAAGAAAGAGGAAAGAAGGAAAGATAGSVVPGIGTLIGLAAGLLLGKIIEWKQKKKKKEEEEGTATEHKIKKLMRNPFVLILLVIIILIILIIGVEKDETIDSLTDLIERRQVRYAESSGVTFTRDKLDEDGKQIVDENGNVVKEKIKPLILFTNNEIDEMLYTSYLYEDQDTKFPYDFKNSENAGIALNEGVSWLLQFSFDKLDEMEDPCYNQTLYYDESNEIADFLSSAGIDTEEIKNSEEVDASDQLQVASYFVKYCINSEKQNFNAINWSIGDDNGDYIVKESETFSSEEDYLQNSVKTDYTGNGSVIANEIPSNNMREYLNSGIKIPDLSIYPITSIDLGNYEINNNYFWNSTDRKEEAEGLMHYVSMTDGHLMKWIVPFALLTDTNGDYEYVKKITEDAQSKIGITLFNLQQLTKVIEREYYLKTKVYYTYDVTTYRYDLSRLNLAYNSINWYNPVLNLLSESTTTHEKTIPTESNSKDEPVDTKRGTAADVGRREVVVTNNNGIVTRTVVSNVKRVTELELDGAGNPQIALDENNEKMIKEIRVKRNISNYQIVPQIVTAEDMYTVNSYTYLITPISEEEDWGDTEGNENTPPTVVDKSYGVVTTTKTYHENLSSGFSETKKYSLSYLSDDEEKTQHISRIEWAQDYGKLVEGEGSSELVGSDNLEKIWNFLKGKGCSDIATAGIIGNIGVESAGTFKGTILQNHIADVDSYYQRYSYNIHDGVGAGICQWTYWSRKKYLADLANLSRSEWYDLGVQLDCLWNEINGLNGASRQLSSAQLSSLNSMSDISAATEYFMNAYERPGVPHLDSRINYATGAYNLYANSTPNANIEENENESSEETNITVGEKIASSALDAKDTKYVEGGQDLSSGVDTGGLIKIIYSRYGYPMPNNVSDQYHEGTNLSDISTDKLAPGDLVFVSENNTITRAGIYIGGGKIIEASSSQKKVIEVDLDSSWNKATRILDDNEVNIGSGRVSEGLSSSKANAEKKVIFGEGNIYNMYPTKTVSERQETYNKYDGTRKAASSNETYPKGYSKEELVVAFEVIEEAYRDVIGSDDDPLSDLNAQGGEGADVSAHCNKTYTMGGRTYYNLIQSSYGSNYIYGGGLVSQQGCTIIAISVIGKAFGTDGYLEQCCTNRGKYVGQFAYVVSDLNYVTKKNWSANNGPRAGGSKDTSERNIDQNLAKGYPVLIECLGAKRGGTPSSAGGFSNGNQHWMVLCDVKVENGQKYYYIQTLSDRNTGWFTSTMLFANLNRYYIVTN